MSRSSRTVAWAVSAVLAVAVLAACGEGNETSVDPVTTSPSSTEPTETTGAGADSSGEDPPTTGEIPSELRQLVASRVDGGLPDGALVGYQHLTLAPGIGDDVRFVLFPDGRLFAAPKGAPLPDAPSSTVSASSVAEVEDALRSTRFAASKPFVGNVRVRDGDLVIVTARADGAVKEVWFQNASTELTDLLSSLYAADN